MVMLGYGAGATAKNLHWVVVLETIKSELQHLGPVRRKNIPRAGRMMVISGKQRVSKF
jgi:hypothetical protein